MTAIQNKVQKRNLSLDLCKMIGIFLITFIHVYRDNEIFYRWGGLFKLSIFFIITGFLFSLRRNGYENRTFLEHLKTSTFRLIVPYIFFSILSLIFDIIFTATAGGDIGQAALDSFLLFITLRGEAALWFLPVMFVAEIIFFLIVKSKRLFMHIIQILLSLSVLIISQLVILPLNPTGFFYDYFGVTLIKIVVSILFIEGGFFLQTLSVRINSISKIVIGSLLVVGCSFLCLVSMKINYNTAMFGGEYFVLFLLGSFGIPFGLIMILSFVPNNSFTQALSFFGKYSLVLMCIQLNCKIIDLGKYIVSFLPNVGDIPSPLYSIIVFALVLLISFFITVFTKKCIPFLIGIKKTI